MDISSSCQARPFLRRKKTAADRRAQKQRADARLLNKLLAAALCLDHRGSANNKVMRALVTVVNTENFAPKPHVAFSPGVFAPASGPAYGQPSSSAGLNVHAAVFVPASAVTPCETLEAHAKEGDPEPSPTVPVISTAIQVDAPGCDVLVTVPEGTEMIADSVGLEVPAAAPKPDVRSILSDLVDNTLSGSNFIAGVAPRVHRAFADCDMLPERSDLQSLFPNASSAAIQSLFSMILDINYNERFGDD